MTWDTHPFFSESDSRFKSFQQLMARKVNHILLICTPYDAWVMEEDCRLSERIVNEYRSLNLSRPPRLTWAATMQQAFDAMDRKHFDMVIAMPRPSDSNGPDLWFRIKKRSPELPVILLSHNDIVSPNTNVFTKVPGSDRTFVWSGNTDILVALIKSVEDRMNVETDTKSAGTRVIILVQDSPYYLSLMLPILYRELVAGTQAAMEKVASEEHRCLTMRARPKIMIAGDYEEAVEIYEHFESYVLGIICDIRFCGADTVNNRAGGDFLDIVRKRRSDIPFLFTSSDPDNSRETSVQPAVVVDKNSDALVRDVRRFITEQLGFGDFVFRNPDGSKISRASSLKALEQELRTIPQACFRYHCHRNDFSRWLFARTEFALAAEVSLMAEDDSFDGNDHRRHLIEMIAARRRRRQQGIIIDFDASGTDFDTTYRKIGNGSLGGKARGLAFVASLLRQHRQSEDQYKGVDILIPQTLVITTEGFERFVTENGLRYLVDTDLPDEKVAERFVRGKIPDWIVKRLKAYLAYATYPLAVRSSSLFEDAQFKAYAGLYRTYMIPNDAKALDCRLDHLTNAIKLVYASTYYSGPKAFSRRVGHRIEEEQMAVIIQQLTGTRYGNSFYPAISGVAQSYNYYPFARMKPTEGIVTVAMGLGKAVVEGEKTLRFSPAHPQLLPQRSTVEDILENSQRKFYCLKMDGSCQPLEVNDRANLWKREVADAQEEFPCRYLSSTYVPDEHRIRDTIQITGPRVLTFARILKYGEIPMVGIIRDLLELGKWGMGCPVEMEFSVNLAEKSDSITQFAVLQLRPMAARAELEQVQIHESDKKDALCFSKRALGNVNSRKITDIVFVKPDRFDPSNTIGIARQIAKFNSLLVKENQKYLLIGPGRWGSADRWLGIPVSWADISGVGAIIEAESDQLTVEPSQGSHFFHNITTLGIHYIAVFKAEKGWLDWEWLSRLPRKNDSAYVAHVRLDEPLTLKVDGRRSVCVILKGKAN